MRYVVCHDANAELVFKVTVIPIGADARVSSVREEHEDNIYSIFHVTYATTLDVDVTTRIFISIIKNFSSLLLFILIYIYALTQFRVLI